MSVRSSLSVVSGLGLSVAAVLAPLAAPAQTESFYKPPAIARQGTNTTPLAGKGAVTVKIFVNKNGTPGIATIVSSTNSGDNPAALEMAKSARYRPASRDGKPVAAFYTFRFNFNGTSVSADESGASGGGGGSAALGQTRALLGAGKYTEAKAALEPYIVAHPDDREALTLLGVANTFAEDPDGAVAAFDKAGTIDPKYTALAASAYTKVAQTRIGKADDQAIVAASRAVALAPTAPNGYNIRALAEYDHGDNAQAIADFSKTLELAANSSSAAKASINANMAATYLRMNDYTNAAAKANAARALDPANTTAGAVLSQVVMAQARDLAGKGQRAAAVGQLEAAAAQTPSQAGTYYTQAAMLLSAETPPDWTKVKAEVDKALAVTPNDAQANYLAGVALANMGKRSDAKPYLQKAKDNVGSDAVLGGKIDTALKQVSS